MKILVVDDEYVSLTKMQILLSEYGKCDTASDGQQALDMFHQSYLDTKFYDLFAIDIELPIMSGLELVRTITRDEKYLFMPPAKKIIITAAGSTNNVFQAIESKCDAFLIKPIKKEFLKEKLIEIGIIKKN